MKKLYSLLFLVAVTVVCEAQSLMPQKGRNTIPDNPVRTDGVGARGKSGKPATKVSPLYNIKGVEEGEALVYGYLYFDYKYKTYGLVGLATNAPGDYDLIYDYGKTWGSKVFTAATFVGDKLFAFENELIPTTNRLVPMGFGSVDTKTGEYLRDATNTNQSLMLNDMTYDPKTDKIYAIHNDTEYQQTTLYEINKRTCAVNTVAIVSDALMTLSADNGFLYGVGMRKNGSDGYLLRIDQSSIDATAQTCKLDTINYEEGLGVKVGDFWQSMEFDKTTHRLWWVAQLADETSQFIEIDPVAGRVLSQRHITDEAQILSLSIPYQFVEDNAPSFVKKFKAVASNDNCVSLSFVTPAVDYRNNVLGNLSGVKIFRDGTLVKDLSVTEIGKETTWVDEVVAEGTHIYKVLPYNSVGEGIYTEKNVFVGKDVPGEVRNISITAVGSKATLSWDAPEAGANGGFIDEASLRYDVVRMPGEKQIVTGSAERTVTDEVEDFAGYYYVITGVNDEGRGIAATSNVVAYGPAFDIPFAEDMSAKEGFEKWTAFDNNADETTWTYDEAETSAVYDRSMGSADDYLVSPPVNFEKDKQYQLRYTYSTANWVDADGNPINEKMKVYYGQKSSADGMTKLISDLGEFHTASNMYLYGKDVFTPENQGIGYVGFQACSDANKGKIYLKDISIREYSAKDISVKGFTGSTTVNSGVLQTYTVDVVNEGSAAVEGYRVQVISAETGEVLGEKAGTKIGKDETAEVAVDWTPGAVGTIKVTVKAVLEGDTYPADNVCGKTIDVSVAAADAERYVTLNEKNTYGWALPFYLSFNYYQGQCIYLEREMQKKGVEITGMRLHYDGHEEGNFTFPAKIYMKHTELDNLSLSALDPYVGVFEDEGWTEVYDGNVTIGGNAENTELVIKFDNKFKYEGGNVNIKFEVPFHNDVLATEYHPDWYFANENTAFRSSSFRSTTTDLINPDEIYVYDYVPYLQLSYEGDGYSGIFTVGADNFSIMQRGNMVLLSSVADNVEVFTASGERVYDGRNVDEISLNGMNKGVYLLRAAVGGKIENIKFVVK